MHTNRCFSIRLPVKGGKLEELSDLKKNISALVKSQLYWRRKVKRASAIFEHILQKNKDRRIIYRKELLNYNETLVPEFRLEENEITTLLKHLHQAGTLLYFEEPALKDTIILDVQWLVDAFKSIIAYHVDIEKEHDIERQRFYETGELNNEELDAIWERQQIEGKDYITHKKNLMPFMEKLGLLAVCNSDTHLWYYFPSMNRKKFVSEHEQFKKSSILIFQFEKEKQLPIFLFYSFIIKCLKLPFWKILTEGQCRCIYDEVACFSFREHIVLLCVCNFQIQVQVCHPVIDIKNTLLQDIKYTLEETMKEFQNYRFKVGYKCQKGKFHDDELNFIPEEVFGFSVNHRLCEFCSVWNKHTLGNEICWVNLK